ncbi:hypothetical protein A2U01_0066079, partial [Trifolium medium]|nr:hypothetical protein [Trifolium medium]
VSGRRIWIVVVVGGGGGGGGGGGDGGGVVVVVGVSPLNTEADYEIMIVEIFTVTVEHCTEPLCYGGGSGGDSDDDKRFS